MHHEEEPSVEIPGPGLIRPRRLRRSEVIRDMVAETRLHPNMLVQPHFVMPGKGQREEIGAMPGIQRESADMLLKTVAADLKLGLRHVLLFGLPEEKSPTAESAIDLEGVVPQAIRILKQEFGRDLLISADICVCAYTDHGHCGIIKDQEVDNDETLPLLAGMALACAVAGADMVAPSDMMDGRVGAIRTLLDEHGHQDVAILAYAAKFASAFYGPFRDAAESAPAFGDRRSYQMDPPNGREAMREMRADLEEGADALMVKPALPYIDLLAQARREFDVPLAAYHVSGEYAMIKAAAERGWIDGERAMDESLVAIKRAGADWILTYAALEVAARLG